MTEEILSMHTNMLIAGVKRMEPSSFHWCPVKGQVAEAQTETHEVLLEYEKKLLFFEGDRALERVG